MKPSGGRVNPLLGVLAAVAMAVCGYSIRVADSARKATNEQGTTLATIKERLENLGQDVATALSPANQVNASQVRVLSGLLDRLIYTTQGLDERIRAMEADTARIEQWQDSVTQRFDRIESTMNERFASLEQQIRQVTP